MQQEIHIEGLSQPISHYTHATRFGDLVFISGIPPTDANGKIVGGDDAAAQARQIFLNMQKVLASVGSDFSQIVKVTVYLTSVADREIINPIRQEFFGDSRPASTLIGVKELAVPGMKVEVEAVVGLKSG